nr:MAG TPA: hypothetical protein [Bacteriophage sp.]
MTIQLYYNTIPAPSGKGEEAVKMGVRHRVPPFCTRSDR